MGFFRNIVVVCCKNPYWSHVMKRISQPAILSAGLAALLFAVGIQFAAPSQVRGGMGNMPGMGNMTGMHMKVKPTEEQVLLPWAKVAPLVKHDDTTGTANKSAKLVTFTGRKIHLVFVAVEPGFPDTTYEVHKLVDPTISVPAGSVIRLTLVNMDYGPGMIHGIAIGTKAPPYGGVMTLPLPGQLTSIPLMMPRTGSNIKKSSYWVCTVTFTCKKAGTYYYLCQMPAHAKAGMYGKFIVRK